MIRFLLIICSLMAYTAYKMTQFWPTYRTAAALAVVPVFAVILGWQFIYRSNPTVIDAGWFRVVAWTGSVAMGLWATFILLSIPVDLIALCIRAYDHFVPSVVEDGERRTFLAHSIRIGVLAVSASITALGLREVIRGAQVKQVEVVIADLPDALRGLKIAQISDLHIGPTIQRAYVEDVVQKTNRTEPDLIFVTGDLADGKAGAIESHLAPLGQLKSRYGTFFITGNHEYYWGAHALIETTSALGFIPLINQNREIQIRDHRVRVVGVTDPSGVEFIDDHASDIKKAVSGSTKSDLNLLLAHRPGACFEAEPLGFDLQFSGHTHSGQFFPFSTLIPFAHKYYRGLNRHGRMWVYVNPGTGYWGPANRFAISPEITLVKLG